jgi:hypothetical protein
MRAVQRNLVALGLYLAITVGAGAVMLATNYLMGDTGGEPRRDLGVFLYEIAANIVLIACVAAAQAMAFARLGKDIDRPLWKVSGDREALARYFLLWLILNAVVMVLREIAIWLPVLVDDERIGGLPSWLFAFAAVVYLPIGAAIMFRRGFAWREFGEALAPFRRQLPKTAVVLLFNGILFFFTLSLIVQTESQKWLGPAIDAISGYFECVVFSAVWLICMLDRQTPEEIDLEF